MASLLALVFRLVSKRALSSLDDLHCSDGFTSFVQKEWEYAFAVRVCEQYSCIIWLPALVKLLQQIGIDNYQDMFAELLFVMKFTLQKLQDPEFAFKLESKEDSDNIQVRFPSFGKHITRMITFWKAFGLSFGISEFTFFFILIDICRN